LKVLYITAECKPYSKAGGVGDVAGELPPALKRLGVDIEIVTPWYGQVQLSDYAIEFNNQAESVGIISQPEVDGVPVNFIKNAHYFEGAYGTPYVHSSDIPFKDDILRFSFFSEACLHLIEQKKPDIVHVNDWVLGYLFGRMEMEEFTQKRVMTVHNIGYQGTISRNVIQGWSIESIAEHKQVGPLFSDPRTEWNSVNALKLGLELAHQVNTVSPTYANEISEPEDASRFFEGAKGLHETTSRLANENRLIGITNGFNYTTTASTRAFNTLMQDKAEARAALSAVFPEPDSMLFGFVGRAVEQKFKLLTEKVDGISVLEQILDIPGVNIAIVATGLPEYESFIRHVANRPNCSATLAFDREKAAQISLGSDVFLMPSLFEPCGITQMESMSCATPPLVRWTGGLVDTVTPHTSPEGTGFGFGGNTQEEILRGLIDIVREAKQLYDTDPERFRSIQQNGFEARFNWEASAQRYIDEVYASVLPNHRSRKTSK
jgi:starch synthase